MIKKDIDTLAMCPFFRYHTSQTIACEGLIPESGIINSWADINNKRQQYQLFCCGAFKNCEVYLALMSLYDEDGER